MRIEQIIKALLVHLEITFLGVVLASLLGIILASLIKNMPKLSKVILLILDVIQTVPTLAMLTFIMLIFGLNDNTVIVAIFLYSLFPIMRNTITGISGVDKGIIRAGRGIGMTELQIYTKVELPLALPVILSGIRMAIITALGITTTGVLIGAGGLGMLIWRGIQTRNTTMMLAGAIPVSVLAVIFDFLLSYLEKKIRKGIK